MKSSKQFYETVENARLHVHHLFDEKQNLEYRKKKPYKIFVLSMVDYMFFKILNTGTRYDTLSNLAVNKTQNSFKKTL